MVIIEPYRWIKSTALKERLDLANKLNEIIDAIAPIDPDTINDINARLDALVLADTSISDRITTLDAKNVKTDTEQTITGKKAMTNTNNDVRVKTTPDNIVSSVNQNYVESTVLGVNNLVHKSANETIAGNKVLEGITTFKNYIPLEKSIGSGFGDKTCIKLWTADASTFSNHRACVMIMGRAPNITLLVLSLNNSSSVTIGRSNVDGYPANYIYATIDENNVFTLWAKRVDSTARIFAKVIWEGTVNYDIRQNILTPSGVLADEPVAEDYNVFVQS